MCQPPPPGWPVGDPAAGHGDPQPWRQPPPPWQQPPPWQPPPGPQSQIPRPPKLGCVPLRPLGVGDILDGSIQIIRRNPRVMLGVAAIVAVIQATITGVVQFLLYRQLDQARFASADGGGSPAAVLDPLGRGLGLVFSSLMVATLFGAIVTGVLAPAITEDVLGRTLGLGETWNRARARIWPLLGLAAFTTVLETLGLIPCLVLGLWLWGRWAVAVPALMVEGNSIRGALGRSRQLVNGSFWRVWGIRALGFFLVAFISQLVTLPFAVLGAVIGGGTISDLFGPGSSGVPVVLLLATSAGSIVSLTLTAPIKAAIDALLYVDLRMRKEGLDLVLQQQVARHPFTAMP